MIAGLLLLGAVGVLCSPSVAAHNQTCVPSHEVACFMPVKYLNASGPVSLEVTVPEKLIISLEGFGGHPVCQWIRGKDLIMTIKWNHSVEPLSLSQTDSGVYTMKCETSNGTRSFMNVSLHVLQRPTKPEMMLIGGDWKSAPKFKCTSDGNPSPKITFHINNDKKIYSKLSSSDSHDKGLMCCATNTEGQECSQLYDYDLDSDLMKSDEVSNVTVSPGWSLLLRCRFNQLGPPSPEWSKGNSKISKCETNNQEMCFINDEHDLSRMAYLFIKAVRVDHSGTYTCKNLKKNKTKSFYVHVQAEGLLSVQLDKNKTIPEQNASSSCLQANVTYHPVLEVCSWEAPDKTMTKCKRDSLVTKHSSVKLCAKLISGDYKLHVEAGGQKQTKTMSVCVAGKPQVDFKNNGTFFTFEIVSFVPASYKWVSCSSSNNSSCETDSDYEEIPGTFQRDTDVFCNKKIKVSLSKELGNADKLKICLTNSFGSWCNQLNYTSPQQNKGALITGPIYLIFQYCCYGDLLNYLKTSCKRYHKSVTDAFIKDRFSSLYHNLQYKRSETETVDNYVPVFSSTTRGQEDIELLNLNSADLNSYEGSITSQVDGTREHLSGDVHHEE
ncbi:hypothetical protein Q5P01_004093 [Channa striata]|uniref:Ig-like domain-containing protein n=1 Tax=Channa striata TaxID=64152 RepID=A0AA88NH37_CHASR|nr:hypothetical protein Q5P01_004093 [Channa striata]